MPRERLAQPPVHVAEMIAKKLPRQRASQAADWPGAQYVTQQRLLRVRSVVS